jgi:hypothetical protein
MSNHIWFCSFFHVEHESTIVFTRIIIENKKQSEIVSNSKNQKRVSDQIEPNKQTRKLKDTKWSWKVQAFTWKGFWIVLLELDFFLGAVMFSAPFSFTFLRRKRWILAYECLVKVFDGIETGFEWEFEFWKFEKMKKMVVFLSSVFCAVFWWFWPSSALKLMFYI